jgi:ATP synthase protein I
MRDEGASERLRDLGVRVKRLQAAVEPKAHAAPSRPMGPGVAFEIAGHLVAGLLVGGTIGYFLDQWLDTAPALLLLFFFMGAAAGMVNVYRTVTGMGMAAGYRPGPTGRPIDPIGGEVGPGDRDAKKGEE